VLSVNGGAGRQHRVEGALPNQLIAPGRLFFNDIDLEIVSDGHLANQGSVLWGTAASPAGRVGGAGTFVNERDALLTIDASDARLEATLHNGAELSGVIPGLPFLSTTLRVCRFYQYDLDQLNEAWARFEELRPAAAVP
jgi:hypothetical protein